MLCVASVAHAEVDGIRDNGAFFSARAKTEALSGIDDIGKRFRKDLVYETYSAIPQDLKQGVDLADKAAMGRFYEEWALKQAKQQRVNGIYILLVKEPPHLQILVGNDTQKRAFSLKDRDELRSLMLPKLHNKQYDEALLESVRFVSATLLAHAPTRGRTPVVGHRSEAPSSSNNWLIKALLIGGAVWLVLRIVRAVAGGGGNGGGYSGTAMTPGVGGGGGGFMSNMLGGMFGAAAGMWIYDQFSGRSSSWGGGDTGYGGDNGGNGDTGYSGQDTDYSGSGGDYGDNDSGGGDSGGGDFGGGGDF